MTDFTEFKECHKREKSGLERYMVEMEFFRNKYETCIEEGLRARYPMQNVEKVCGNNMIKFIRSHNDIL